MWQWLLRLLGLNTRQPAAQTPSGAKHGSQEQRDAQSAHAAPGPATAPASSGSSAPTAQALQVLRRPLLHQDGSLAGFEHSVAAAASSSSHPQPGADRAAEARPLLTAMGYTVTSGRQALAVLQSSWLADPEVQHLIQPGMMFGLSDNPFQQALQAPLLAELRRRGAVLGSTGLPRAGAAFVVFDAATLDRQGLLDRARACAAAAPGAQVVATGIRTYVTVEHRKKGWKPAPMVQLPGSGAPIAQA